MKIKKRLLKIFIVLIVLTFFIFKITPSTISAYSNYNHYQIFDKNDELIVEMQNGHLISKCSFEEIPKDFIEILLFLEDKNFFNHSGFDLYRIGKTIFTNIFHNQKHGASTITQQYIKNVYLTNEKSFGRKFKEIVLSITLEQKASKEDILTEYLSTVNFGNKQYGIKYATKYYFNKELDQLTINEMVMLCAMLKAPSNYNLVTNPDEANIKKDELLKHLLEHNMIDRNEFNSAYKVTLKSKNKTYFSTNFYYFWDILKQEINAMDHSFSLEETIKIYTNYDPSFDLVNLKKPEGDYAAIIADKQGYITYLLGGPDYLKSSFNLAYYGNRDIGSTIKPLLYYEALRCGYTVNSSFDSHPYTIKYKDEFYTFNNFNSSYPNHPIDMTYALATSDNIYAVKMHLSIGMKTLVNHLKHYDIEAKTIPSLALGSVSMSLKQLTQIYQTFQNDGNYRTFRAIKRMETANQIYQLKIKNTQKLDPSTTKTISSLMEGMFDQSIASNVTGASIANQLPCTVSGKSGLTDYDSYMIGYNQEYIIGCWAGYSNNDLLVSSELKAFPKKLFLTYMLNLPRPLQQE